MREARQVSVGPLCGRDPLNRVQQGGDAHRTAVVDGRRQDCPRWGRVILTGDDVHQLRAEPARRKARSVSRSRSSSKRCAASPATRTAGFIDLNSPDYLIWHIVHRSRVEDIQSTTVASKDSRAILLNQMTPVRCTAAMKRGDAGDDRERATAGRGAHRAAPRRHHPDRLGEPKKSLSPGLAATEGAVPVGRLCRLVHP